MPYSTDNPPERIRDLPEHAQTIWVNAFNGAYDGTCAEDGDREGCANRIAWTAVEKAGYTKDEQGNWHKSSSNARRAQRGELIALAKGDSQDRTLTIQVLRAGSFVDMTGKEFTLSSQDLDAYVANSNALLASEQVPVEIGHPENEDGSAPAAAWYRKFFKKVVDGIEWVCAEVELTALGADALAKQLYKYFSAVIWLDDQVICGGGFVNRPAVSGQQPVGSLAATIHYVEPRVEPNQSPKESPMSASASAIWTQIRNAFLRSHNAAALEMSQEDMQRQVMDALYAKYADPLDEYGGAMPWLVATYDDRVIVTKNGNYYEIAYSFDADGNVVLGDPVEVEITYQPSTDGTAALSRASAAQGALSRGTTTIAPRMVPTHEPKPATASATTQVTMLSQGGQSPMSKTVPVQTTAPVQTPPADVTAAKNPAEVEKLLEQARADARRAAEAQAQEMEVKLAQAREQERERVMRELQRKETVNSLVLKLTSGRRQFPYRPTELADALLKLSDADYQIVAPILEKIQETGLVELGERGVAGHGMTMLKRLNDETRAALTRFLSAGGKVETFFKANAQLGKVEEYDLSEFGADVREK